MVLSVLLVSNMWINIVIILFFFQIFSLKIMEIDDHKLTSLDLFSYAENFKIILENKAKMNCGVYKFIVTRLIDNVLLASTSKVC